MKFLVDESIEYPFIQFLKNKKFDTKAIIDINPGMKDKDVLKLAYNERRILITNDKDFGQLAIHQHYPTRGIIIFRLPYENAESKIKIFSIILKKFKNKLYNSMLIITNKQIRFFKL